MEDIQSRISELSDLMQEFGLDEARLSGPDWLIEFSRLDKVPRAPIEQTSVSYAPTTQPSNAEKTHKKEVAKTNPTPSGIPITSPITGIFYNAPTPSSPPFVKKGEHIEEGHVIGLVEAMKVFNEIISPKAGTASEYIAKTNQLVHPGDALIYIE